MFWGLDSEAFMISSPGCSVSSLSIQILKNIKKKKNQKPKPRTSKNWKHFWPQTFQIKDNQSALCSVLWKLKIGRLINSPKVTELLRGSAGSAPQSYGVYLRISMVFACIYREQNTWPLWDDHLFGKIAIHWNKNSLPLNVKYCPTLLETPLQKAHLLESDG